MKNTKRIIALVLSLAMMIGMIATVGAAGTNAWYMPAVTYIENCGIDTIGTKDATPITRNDFVYWVHSSVSTIITTFQNYYSSMDLVHTCPKKTNPATRFTAGIARNIGLVKNNNRIFQVANEAITSMARLLLTMT